MAKKRNPFLCDECGGVQSKWLGRCPDCGTWDSLREFRESKGVGNSGTPSFGSGSQAFMIEAQPARRLEEIDPDAQQRLSSGSGEFDRVLGGGLVPGSSVLLCGEPGIGKSTLMLQASMAMSRKNLRFLYVGAEESAAQIKMRAERLGRPAGDLYVQAECDLERVEAQIAALKPHVVGVDSIQAMRWSELPSAAGSVMQVREVTARLLQLARSHGFPLILVGHVTKEGSIAGPRLLEHMVDSVLNFEGERTHDLRILRAVKNRFGSTQEVGLFEMYDGGLREVTNPSELLLGERHIGSPGAATAVVLEGSRSLLVEVQALVSPSSHGSPARKVSGFDSSRLSMLAAVLEKRLRLPLGESDIFTNVVGGVRLGATDGDLALCAALISSAKDRTLDPETVYTGEVGLLGEVRPVGALARRLEEASRLGFARAIVPMSRRKEQLPKSIEIIQVSDLGELLHRL